MIEKSGSYGLVFKIVQGFYSELKSRISTAKVLGRRKIFCFSE